MLNAPAACKTSERTFAMLGDIGSPSPDLSHHYLYMGITTPLTTTLLFLTLTLSASSGQLHRTRHKVKNNSQSQSRRAKPTIGVMKLMADLRARGATVGRGGTVSQSFFSTKGRIITVNKSDVQVFEHANASLAEAEAKRISSNGTGTGTSRVSWIATPHFYRRGNLITLYIGDDASVIDALAAVLGQQFAGG